MFLSVGYTMDKMYLSTLPSPVDVDSEIVLTDGMSLVDASTRDCSMNYTSGTTSGWRKLLLSAVATTVGYTVFRTSLCLLSVFLLAPLFLNR